jgi:hypothetical protein
MRRIAIFPMIMIIAATLLVGTVNAHHSMAMFDGQRVVKVSGTVTAFRWVNPHAVFELDGAIEGESGSTHWIVEMHAPNTMTEVGWSRTTLAVGDRITVFANPARDSAPVSVAHRLLYMGIILPGGMALGHVDDNP